MKCEMKNWHLITVGFLLVIFLRPLADVWDDVTTEQPWFHANIEIQGERVRYQRQINRQLRGEWTVTVQKRTDTGWAGQCSGDGRFTYRPAMSGTLYLSFGYFTGGCEPPDGPFRICADYVMEDMRGRTRYFGPFCTGDDLQ